MNTAQSNFSEQDLTFAPATFPAGISGFMGVTKRGPINNPKILITSWPQFVKIYGGFSETSDFPQACKRALDGGSALRVANIRHYTNIADPESFDANFAAIVGTSKYALSIAVIAGVTLTFTIGATNVSQVFVTDSISTLAALAVKIKNTFATSASDVVVLSGTEMKVAVTSGSGVLTASGAGAPVITKTTVTGFLKGATALFDLTPKYPGSDYNNLRVTCKKASNNAADSFDLVVEIVGDSASVENWKNLKIPGNPTDTNSNYLKELVVNSNLVNVTYHDLSGIGALPIVPDFTVCRYSGGTDGSAVTDSDFIGDSASKTGFNSFDPIDDIMQIGYYGESIPVHVAGSAYASGRKDLEYWAHLDNANQTESALVAARNSSNIDDSYTRFFAGGLKVLNPFTSQEKNISEIGDIMALAANCDKNFGPWYSFAGSKRGIIKNALGVVNNFGTPGNLANMNYLANNQINVVVNRSKKIMLWGNFTAQLANSQLSFANIRRLNIYLKKILAPLVENYLEEPNEPSTWKEIYLAIKPTLDNLADQRAFHGKEGIGWVWQGDQFANSPDDYIINDPADVSLGKYKAILYCKDVVSLQEFSLAIVLTNSGVSFEDLISDNSPF